MSSCFYFSSLKRIFYFNQLLFTMLKTRKNFYIFTYSFK